MGWSEFDEQNEREIQARVDIEVARAVLAEREACANALEAPDSAASALSAGLEGAECRARALEILEALARLAAEGKSITIAEDCGFGTATVIDQNGAHSHVGVDCAGSEQENFRAFVSQLHGLLVGKRGLSWVKPSNVELTGAGTASG